MDAPREEGVTVEVDPELAAIIAAMKKDEMFDRALRSYARAFTDF
jgi:hypothetical protein